MTVEEIGQTIKTSTNVRIQDDKLGVQWFIYIGSVLGIGNIFWGNLKIHHTLIGGTDFGVEQMDTLKVLGIIM